MKLYKIEVKRLKNWEPVTLTHKENYKSTNGFITINRPSKLEFEQAKKECAILINMFPDEKFRVKKV